MRATLGRRIGGDNWDLASPTICALDGGLCFRDGGGDCHATTNPWVSSHSAASLALVLEAAGTGGPRLP